MHDLKAQNFTSESELRNKMKTSEKEYENKISNMQLKISGLLKEVATLSKSTKRDRKSMGSSSFNSSVIADKETNSGSGTDSPVP